MSDADHAKEPEAVVRIVIVDDHLLLADGLAVALSAEGDLDVVAVAASCAEGLDAVSRHRPDVLLLDQHLPDGLGTDLLPRLFAALSTLKVLLVTAETSDQVLVDAIEGGCAGIVRKGVRSADLVGAVRSAARDESVIAADDLRRLLPRLRSRSRLGDDLTPRERDVLQLLVEGTTTAGIAAALVVAPTTARNHVQSVITKLGAHSRLEAVAIALREDIAHLPDSRGGRPS